MRFGVVIDASLQCERYAPKTIRRTADWGWTLKNPNVKYASLNQDLPPPPPAAPADPNATVSSSSSSSASPSTSTPAPAPATTTTTPTLPHLLQILTANGFPFPPGFDAEMETAEDEEELSDMEIDAEENRVLAAHRWIAQGNFD